MAGRGPAPRDHRQRPRDEKVAGPWEVLPHRFDGEAPALPKTWRTEIETIEKHSFVEVDEETGEGVRRTLRVPVITPIKMSYLAQTREWYANWATAPMASRFTAVDWDRLRHVIAPLRDQYHRHPTIAGATEIRLQETLLLATVADRQRARVRIEPPIERDAPAAGAGAQVTSMSAAAERRARMRSVPPPAE